MARLGYKQTKEHRRKISEALKGRPSPTKGTKHTVETKRKISESEKGKTVTKETRKKMSLAQIGKKHTEEHIKNARVAMTKAMNKPEVRKKLSLSHLGIKPTEEARKNMSLAKGGTGIPYANTAYPAIFREMRPLILERDNFKCQMSSMTNKQHLKKFGRVLIVHHIDYNKKNCKETNLITLTDSWNKKVNKNRKYWTKYFQEIINQKRSQPC